MKNILIFALTIIALSACKTKNTEPEISTATPIENEVTLTDAQLKNAQIETSTLQKKNISSVLKLNGKTEIPPQNLISVSAPLGGYLKSTKLLPGMNVAQGEIIAILEDPQYVELQQDYLLAKSNLHFAELDFNRQKALNQSQASSDKTLQQAQATMNIHKITMSALAEKLRLINKNPSTITSENISRTVNIYSPISGFVSNVNVNNGKYVTPSEVMFEMINPNNIYLKLKVFEKDISKLSIGQTVTAYNNANPDKKINCTITLINKDISTEGTAEIICYFQTYYKEILPGMYLNAEVAVENLASNTLPSESVVTYSGKSYVFASKSTNQFELIEVKTGEIENGFIVIQDDKELINKSIVTKGAYTLLMKLKNKEE